MRTSINIDDQVYLEAKKYAAQSKKSFAQVIEEALRSTLSRKDISQNQKISLVTVGGDGLKHGIDLDDSQSLNDIMDQ